MITSFGSLFAGHVDLDHEGLDGTPANDRWLSDQYLATVFPKSEAIAKLMDRTGYDTFWLAEHTFLDRCTRSDRTLAWICVLYLFFVSTLPFSASTLAEHVDLAVAVGLYWANLAGLGATLAWQLWHVQRAGMVDDRESITLVRRRLVLAQGMYAAAALVSLASPQWSIVALGAAQLFFVVSPRLPFRA